MPRPRLLAGLALTLSLALSLVLTACSSPVGWLTVTVYGLPAGVDAAVRLTGPGGSSHVVTQTSTISLPPGTYVVEAGTAGDGDAIVPVVYDSVAGSSTLVIDANDPGSINVTYAQRPGSGHLWLGRGYNSPAIVDGYAHDTLAASGTPPADVALAGSTNAAHDGLALDGEGNLWVSSHTQTGTALVQRFDAASLASSGTPAPTVTLDLSALSQVTALAFDADGDLWVALYGSNQVAMYSPAQLLAGGAPAPAVLISGNSGSLDTPYGLAFDGSGNLWVSNFTSSTLVRFDAAQLQASGSPVPTVTLTTDGNDSIFHPVGLAFDASGNLWATNTGYAVTRFDASQLLASGSPTPAATLHTYGSVPSEPANLAFDHEGSLWVATYSGLMRFRDPGALAGDASPKADVVIPPGEIVQGPIAFSPPPPGSPLQTP